MKRYLLCWKCDGTEEVYYTQEEQSGRINTLENQGYELWEDFWIRVEFV